MKKTGNEKHIETENGIIRIFGYTIIFHRDDIELVEIEADDIPRVADFNRNEISDRLDHSKIKSIILNKCYVKGILSNEISINEVSLERCSLEKNINFNSLEYSFSNTKNASIVFTELRRSCSFRGTDLILKSNGEIYNIKHLADNELRISEIGISGIRIDGVCQELTWSSKRNSPGRDSLSLTCVEDFLASKVSLLNEKIFMKGLHLKKDSIFVTNWQNSGNAGVIRFLRLDTIERIDGIWLREGILGLQINNVNLHDTKIYFENNASLNVDSLKSSATVWNPSNIKYRGFCPEPNIFYSRSRLDNTKLFLSRAKIFFTKIDILSKDDRRDFSDRKCNFNNEVSILSAQEFFSEMKAFFIKRGDGVRASFFYAAEMKAYRKYLTEKYFFFNHNRLLASWSYLSSDFGQNWVKPFFWYLFFGVSVSIVFVLFHKGVLDNGLNISTISLCWKTSSSLYLASVLSPLSIKFGSVTEYVDINQKFIFLWMFWKVVAGYLIFQIVNSTRRYIK